MEKQKLKILKNELEHVNHSNKFTPFPVFDTEYVGLLKKEIEVVDNNKDVDYDELPVEACKHCKSLYITVDDEDNGICMRCGSVNEVVTYNNIDEYIKISKNIWNK